MEFSEVNINELLGKDAFTLSQHKLTLQNIQIETHLDPEIPMVWGDFNQIQQCIVNLIFNSVDAMPEGGTLTLRSYLNQHNDIVEISVEDTGHGIAGEDLPYIFDPFYSTKTEGKGLGSAFRRFTAS